MSLVHWFGKPEHWMPPDTSFEDAKWVLAATDDALPEVLKCSSARYITPDAALKAIDRYYLRQSLYTQFNPEWNSFTYNSRVVVKAPGSALASGVRIVDLEAPEVEIVRWLRAMLKKPKEVSGVIEHFVEGDAIELSGAKLNGQIHFFHPLRQHWKMRPLSDMPVIERYERAFDHWWLYDETRRALDCIGLDDSAFCVEWRVTGYQQAKVIEINPRPGEDDKGYFEALWDIPIADQIESWAQEVYRAELQETAQAHAQAVHG